MIDLLNDLNDDEQLPRPRQTRIRLQQRLVPRTRASERVRMNTQRLRQNVMVYIVKHNNNKKNIKIIVTCAGY